MTDTGTYRCFFCKEDLTGVDAELHFGRQAESIPACKIKLPGEHALLRALRNAEDLLNRYHAEDSDIIQAMHSMSADHRTALRQEEEKGYSRGLRDARAEAVKQTSQHPSADFGDDPTPSHLNFFE